MTSYPVKITVLKCLEPSILYEEIPINQESGKPHVKCPVHHQGQVFISESTGTSPNGFCPNAWHDILEYVNVIRHGGSYYPWLEENTIIRCCTDGLRPVIFKIERVENTRG